MGFHSDNGGEFIDGRVQQWASDRGTRWTFTIPGIHQQNGRIERVMRIIGERVRALLADTKLPDSLWGELAKIVAFLRNLSPYDSNRHRQ